MRAIARSRIQRQRSALHCSRISARAPVAPTHAFASRSRVSPSTRCRTFFTAAFLLGVGVIFSVLGLSFLFTLGLSEALPFLIIGGIGAWIALPTAGRG